MSHVRCLFALGLGTSAPWSAPPQIEILPYHHPAPAHPLTPVPSPLPSPPSSVCVHTALWIVIEIMHREVCTGQCRAFGRACFGSFKLYGDRTVHIGTTEAACDLFFNTEWSMPLLSHVALSNQRHSLK